MDGRKLDTRGLNNLDVKHKRDTFDRHLNDCTECQPTMCGTAQSLWRDVCLTALRTAGGA